MSLLPRVRLLLARRPWIYWSLVALCAGLVWLSVSAATARVDEQRARWGATRRVWVSGLGLAPGDPIVAAARDYPEAMVPADALAELPAGAAAAHTLAAGEVLVATDVAGDGGLVPDGWMVFSVAADGTPRLRAADPVAVFGSGQRWCDGLTISVAEATVDVAVPADCGEAVSAQIALGTVTLARLP